MKPVYALSNSEKNDIAEVISRIRSNPYSDYVNFRSEVDVLLSSNALPRFFLEVTAQIRKLRADGEADVHLIENCPIDAVIPELDHDDPSSDKYLKKKTFLGEAFLSVFSALMENPLLAYGSRNRGDFFTDVIAINKYSGKLTGFSDGELVFHNDRTAHEVRADYVTLLGMRCPTEDLIYTGYVDGRELLRQLSPSHQTMLRRPIYVTHFDVFSKDTNKNQIKSHHHAILENEHSFRYLDTMTTYADDVEIAKEGLLALKDAITKAQRARHRIKDGDLLTFANQNGLHNREKIDIKNHANAKARWLLKTYAFRDDAAADRHSHLWADGIRGRLAD